MQLLVLYRALFAYSLICFYFYSAVYTSFVLLYDNNNNNNNNTCYKTYDGIVARVYVVCRQRRTTNSKIPQIRQRSHCEVVGHREAGGGVRQNLKYVNAARKSSWNCCMRCIYVCVIRSSTGDDRATLASTAITAAVGADRSPDNGVAGGGRDARMPTSCRLSPGCPRPPAWSRPVGQVFRPNTNDEERKMHTQIYVER